MLVIVAPGQGAQSPGFLVPWLADRGFADRLQALSEVSELDLAHFGTEADADAIRDTKVAQPLLVATGLAALGDLFDSPETAASDDSTDSAGPLSAQVGALSGHSVGELTAAAASGAISHRDAMILVRERSRSMAEAAATTATGMTAILGGQRDDVLEVLERYGLTPANDNGPGQIVAAGTADQLRALAADPPARARMTPLSVAGAFHTEHMAPAVARLESVAASVQTHDLRPPVISNRDGAVVTDADEVLARIVGQIANPVRWDLCMTAMLDLGATGVLELPPAGVLTGIAKRNLKGVATFALKTPDQLAEARAFCAQHAGSPTLDKSDPAGGQ